MDYSNIELTCKSRLPWFGEKVHVVCLLVPRLTPRAGTTVYG